MSIHYRGFTLVTIIAVFLVLGCAQTAGGGVQVKAEDILYIYDADTFFIKCAECPKGKQSIRVMGVDAAEIRGKCEQEKILARQAKQFTVDKLRNAHTIRLRDNPKRQFDRYNRRLSYVVIDGIDLGKSLIEADLGRAYDGGIRQGWC